MKDFLKGNLVWIIIAIVAIAALLVRLTVENHLIVQVVTYPLALIGVGILLFGFLAILNYLDNKNIVENQFQVGVCIMVIVFCIYLAFEKLAARWEYLQQLQKEGKIKFLRKQAKYSLIPLQIEFIEGKVKTVEEECVYVADFAYDDAKGNLHVEDIKDYEDDAYEVFEIKRKLMRWIHKIVIEQV